jgi:SAM-dependent methyltransferase
VPTDIARREHWEKVWKSTRAVHGYSRYNYYDFLLANLFRTWTRPGDKVLEIGCGGSRWLGFFAGGLGLESWGIDYSPEGLKLLEQSYSGVPNVCLVLGDFFDPTLLPAEQFDFIYSLGFIEHFTETPIVTQRIAQLLRPGGRVMTLVPNFVSTYGRLQKLVVPDVFEKHVVLAPSTLDASHATAGLTPVMPARYYGCFAPGVVDFGAWQKVVIPPLKVLQHTICWVLHMLRCDGNSRITSPYVVGVYERAES